MNAPSPVAVASITLFERYKDYLSSAYEFDDTDNGRMPEGCTREHLMWMCSTAIEQASGWPVDKLSRWLGFVQGVMTMRGVLTVAEEREFSRPLFHAAYVEENKAIPASVGRIEDKHEVLTMTEDEVHAAYAVLMDSSLQEELMANPERNDVWLLDFVYDSSLRAQLAARAAMLGLTT